MLHQIHLLSFCLEDETKSTNLPQNRIRPKTGLKFLVQYGYLTIIQTQKEKNQEKSGEVRKYKALEN